MHRASDLSSRADNSNFVSGTGPLFITYLICWGLYGVLSVQAYVYYLAFPTDKRFHKWLAYLVYFIETADIIFLTYDAVTDFRYVFGLMYIFGGIVICMVQSYYAYLLNYLRRSKLFTIVVLLAAFTQCSAGIVAGALQAKNNFYATATQTKIPIEIYIFGIANAFCSIIIASLMTHQLTWRNTEWKARHPLVPKIVRFSVETGFMAALAAVTYVVLFFCQVDRLNLIIPSLLLGKIYSNSLFLTLNSRMSLAQGRVQPVTDSYAGPYSGDMVSSGVFAVHVDVSVQVTKEFETSRS